MTKLINFTHTLNALILTQSILPCMYVDTSTIPTHSKYRYADFRHTIRKDRRETYTDRNVQVMDITCTENVYIQNPNLHELTSMMVIKL